MTSENIISVIPFAAEPGHFLDGKLIKIESKDAVSKFQTKRVMALKPTKFSSERLELVCEYKTCRVMYTGIQQFTAHVLTHVPDTSVDLSVLGTVTVTRACFWSGCQWKTDKTQQEFDRHLFVHIYHTKLKCIGTNTQIRHGINVCQQDPKHRNVIPDADRDFLCSWNLCSMRFLNIQKYYDHIKVHAETKEEGITTKGFRIRCKWADCTSNFPNITKLKDHLKSHSDEKLLACPTCGSFFSNRTRFFDHCKRQDTSAIYSCRFPPCDKTFSTQRLRRDHERSHRERKYECKDCKTKCGSPSALKSHILHKHSTERNYSCLFCNRSMKSSADLKRHVKTHERPVFPCKDDKFEERKDCEFEAKTWLILANHIERKHKLLDRSRYQCHVSMCANKYTRGYELGRHLTKKHKLGVPKGHQRFKWDLQENGYYQLIHYMKR